MLPQRLKTLDKANLKAQVNDKVMVWVYSKHLSKSYPLAEHTL